MLYRFAMRKADHNFVQSEQMKKDLEEKWGLRPEGMTAVPMGISRGFLDEIRFPKRGDTTPLELAPVVLHLGSLSAVRRLEVIVDAFAIVAARRPDVRFRFVGDGDVPAERKALEKRAHGAGLRDKVEFTGLLPIEEAWRHVAKSAVCVSPIPDTPLLRVASPTKFIEYLAFAKATVANVHPEHSLIARECDGARIVEWSPEGFAEGILWCLDHPVEAAEMALRGRQWVLENRTYDRLAAQVHREFKRIVSGDRRAPAALDQ
jgi:glycosyltransferase involved in cell wall biosynthesis